MHPRTLVWLGAGTLIGALLPGMGHVALALAAVGLGSVLLLVGMRTSARPRRALGPAFLVVGCAASLDARGDVPTPVGEVRLEGVVIDLDGERCFVRVDRSEDTRGHAVDLGRVAVHAPGTPIGTYLRVEGEVVPLRGFQNPSPHPEWPHPTRNAVRSVSRLEVVAEAFERWTPRIVLARTRHAVRVGIARSLSRRVAGLVDAMVLGEARVLDAADASASRAAGLSHVIAVSGMHVTLLVGSLVHVLVVLLRRVPFVARRWDVRRIAATLGVGLAPVYAEFAGGSPSAWRAAWSASLTYVLVALGRRADPLAVAAGVVVLARCFDPDSLRSVGFVLSILATAAVLETGRVEERIDGELRALVRTTLRATLATAPVTLWCFGTASLVGLLANLVIVPLVATAILPLATLHAGLAVVSLDAARSMAWPTELLGQAFLASNEAFAALGSRWVLPPLDRFQLVWTSTCVSAWMLAPRRRWAILVPLVLGLGLGELHLRHRETPRGRLRMHFVDVGQGDAALLDLPDGSLWVIDAGGRSFGAGPDPGAAVLVPLLRARRRATIDVLVVTHPHPDHFGGVAALADAFPIRELWDTGQAEDEHPDGAWSRTLAELRARGTRIVRPSERCGHPTSHQGVAIEVLAPCPAFDPGWDPNDNSFVLRVTHAGHRVLFLGDAEEGTEARLLRAGLGPFDLVKVGHHGSRTSSTEAFVQAVRPRVAVISAGLANRFGHPHAEVVARWQAVASLHRTDLRGGLIVDSTEGALLLTTVDGSRALSTPK